MIRIFYFAFVICSGVLLPILAEITLHPDEKIQEHSENEKEFVVFCDVKDGSDIRWLDPRGHTISGRSASKTNSIFVEEINHMLQLRFQPLKASQTGNYTCVARISGTEKRKSFSLAVFQPITFSDKEHEYYVTLGTSEVLRCEVLSGPNTTISWTFEGGSIEGDGYMILADGLRVINVTKEKLGTYKCTAAYFGEKQSFLGNLEISLKEAIPPQIISIYKNDTVHGVINTTVTIRCPVIADPWPEIKWMKNNEEIKSPQYNANITTTPKGSVLQFVMTSKEFLGAYTCKAANRLNGTSLTFTLEEGELPAVPEVHVRDTAEKTLRFDITSNTSYPLSFYRIVFKKSSEDDKSWKTTDFGLTDSPTNPYSINNLESDTEYIYKVGSCSEDDLCAFTNLTKITTQYVTTSSTSTIHTVFTQIFILLPAFILGLMQRQRTT